MGIAQRHSVYLVDLTAAAASAAARILSKLYPAQQAMINAALTRTLGQIADGLGKTAGIELGNTVADRIFAARRNDGARNQVAYNPSTAVGQWQPTLPNFEWALYPQWPQVIPYALRAVSSDQMEFRS
jgi:hypothetical protein